jgi:hypothetical protein
VNHAGLSGVLIKIDRAKAHLDDFDAQVRPIQAACQEAIVRERDEQRSQHIFRLGRVPIVPLDLSAIMGDAIHNLRVLLDHLAWQLVKATGGTPKMGLGGTLFPILEQPPTPDRWGRTRPQINPGVPKKLREIIYELQPYKLAKPAHHELAVLHQLDISDKHHELLIAIVGVRNLGWFGEVELVGFNPGPYDDGDEVCRFTYSDAHSEHEFDPVIGFTVCLDEPGAGPWRESMGAARLCAARCATSKMKSFLDSETSSKKRFAELVDRRESDLSCSHGDTRSIDSTSRQPPANPTPPRRHATAPASGR